MRISPTTVRVPVFTAHSVAVNVETEEKVTVERARELFGRFPGIRVVDDPEQARYPMPLTVEGQDDCVVGRIREDLSSDRGSELLGRGRPAPQGRGDQRRPDRGAARRHDPEPVADRPRRAVRPPRAPAGLRRRGLPRLADPGGRADGAGPRSRCPAPHGSRGVRVVGASRTDSGVHALGQVASVRKPGPARAAGRAGGPERAPARVTSGSWRRGPSRTGSTRAAPPGSSATGSSSRPTRCASPFLRGFAWHVGRRLDADAMRQAAACLRGKHDFAAFCAAPGRTRDPVCTVRAVRVVERRGRDRRAGVGRRLPPPHGPERRGHARGGRAGRRSPGWVAAVLAGRDRGAAGPTAPAHGLYLLRRPLPVERLPRRPPRRSAGHGVPDRTPSP